MIPFLKYDAWVTSPVQLGFDPDKIDKRLKIGGNIQKNVLIVLHKVPNTVIPFGKRPSFWKFRVFAIYFAVIVLN